jgi:hypothetical protein
VPKTVKLSRDSDSTNLLPFLNEPGKGPQIGAKIANGETWDDTFSIFGKAAAEVRLFFVLDCPLVQSDSLTRNIQRNQIVFQFQQITSLIPHFSLASDLQNVRIFLSRSLRSLGEMFVCHAT